MRKQQSREAHPQANKPSGGQERARGTSIPGRSVQSAAMIARLQKLPGIEELSYTGLKSVAALRLLAVCSLAEREPVAELTQRFSSVTSAKAFLEFAERLGTFWPDPVQVMRPCCRLVGPDEYTIAQLVDAASCSDRAGFSAPLAGFVRSERHDQLFELARQYVALAR